MKLKDLEKIPNSDFNNVKKQIVAAYLSCDEFVYVSRSDMDLEYANKLRGEGYSVDYDQYKSRYRIKGWRTKQWNDL